MAYELTLEKRPDYLYLRISGDVDDGIAKALAHDVLDAYAKEPMPRVLVDVTRTKTPVSASETVLMVTDYRNMSQRFPVKTAVLYNKSDLAALRFYEVVAQNRGYSTKTFTDSEQAVEWLCGQPSSSHQ